MKYVYDHWRYGGEDIEDKLGSLSIPITDEECWLWYPNYRWMLNKLHIAMWQELECAPHGIEPQNFPVFSKPIMNLYGLSAGTKRLDSWSEEDYTAGHFWMQYLEGDQYSYDFVVYEGKILWSYGMKAHFNEQGSIKMWTSTKELWPPIVDQFIREELSDYKGCFTVETKGKHMFEVMPRMSAQFCDFYGEGWLESVMRLYKDGIEPFFPVSEQGVSYIYRWPKEFSNKIPYVKDWNIFREAEAKCLNIYLPWYENLPFSTITDDPYSYRVAVINASNIDQLDTIEAYLRTAIGYCSNQETQSNNIKENYDK